MRVLTPQQREKYQQNARANSADRPQSGTIYTLQDDGGLKVHRIRVGVSDGYYSQVLGRDLQPGLMVVVGKK